MTLSAELTTFYLTAHQGKEHCTEERFGEPKAKAVEREIRKPYYKVKNNSNKDVVLLQAKTIFSGFISEINEQVILRKVWKLIMQRDKDNKTMHNPDQSNHATTQ